MVSRLDGDPNRLQIGEDSELQLTCAPLFCNVRQALLVGKLRLKRPTGSNRSYDDHLQLNKALHSQILSAGNHVQARAQHLRRRRKGSGKGMDRGCALSRRKLTIWAGCLHAELDPAAPEPQYP